MTSNQIFSDELSRPTTAIAFGFSQRLAQLRPESYILESDGRPFDLIEFADGENCEIRPSDDLHSQLVTQWQDPGELRLQPRGAWYQVRWQGHALDVVVATWPVGWNSERWWWIVADTKAVAASFYDAACTYCHELRDEVLVFRDGCWQKSQRMYRAIEQTNLDSLVLKPGLAAEIRRDCEQFFRSEQVYRQYKLPWKRGALLLGPPGNGKTHCVKGLINALDVPCLYVQSFAAQHGSTEQGNIETVFHRARHTTPCILVLEDLDSLLNEGNRSFFLNELDGFEENDGILTIATTNYPDRLDPSILERPSRFDVKYHFELPAAGERGRYLERWAQELGAGAHVGSATLSEITELTDGFSFAYLKELCVSSLVRWFHERDTPMSSFMRSQLDSLRGQMTSCQSSNPGQKTDKNRGRS